jgi:hypothetical protein
LVIDLKNAPEIAQTFAQSEHRILNEYDNSIENEVMAEV